MALVEWTLGLAFSGFAAAMYGLAFWSRSRIHDEADFLVAGRKLPLMLSSATLFGTWFGAGTLLTAADEVRRSGLRAVALEPLGSGVCLLIAGFFFAAPLWRMKLLTLSDFFRERFGERAELASACILVPSYFGWIAVQFLALAAMLDIFLGIPQWLGVLIVALVGTGYTLLGGMWSVTLTDAVQICVLLAGLVVLGFSALAGLGGGNLASGWNQLLTRSEDGMMTLVPTQDWAALLEWFSVFCIAALGNVPTQDLTQRIFAAKSVQVARRACWLAGSAYIFFGVIPVLLGLIAAILFPDQKDQAILPLLAGTFLWPPLTVLFVLALTAAVLSTIDSAILAPASVLGHNMLPRWLKRSPPLLLTKLSIVGVSALSVITALAGEDAYSLLEEAYALTFVGLFAPLAMGVHEKSRGEKSALLAMGAGAGSWLIHFALGWESFLEPLMAGAGVSLPVALSSVALALAFYWAAAKKESELP